jgi:hypothetical protein
MCFVQRMHQIQMKTVSFFNILQCYYVSGYLTYAQDGMRNIFQKCVLSPTDRHLLSAYSFIG